MGLNGALVDEMKLKNPDVKLNRQGTARDTINFLYYAAHLTSPSILATMVVVKRVKIGEFRDRASELIRRAAGGETVVILNRDREVAKIVPVTSRLHGGGLIGRLARTAQVCGDIEGPILPDDGWFKT